MISILAGALVVLALMLAVFVVVLMLLGLSSACAVMKIFCEILLVMSLGAVVGISTVSMVLYLYSCFERLLTWVFV